MSATCGMSAGNAEGLRSSVHHHQHHHYTLWLAVTMMNQSLAWQMQAETHAHLFLPSLGMLTCQAGSNNDLLLCFD
jgi:hypothetical protein